MKAPHPEAVEAATAGARAELARSRALGGEGYPRVLVEVVRVDEVAAGIAATRVGTQGELPLARGSAVGVVVRTWIEESAGAPQARASADMRRVETVAQGGDAVASSAAFRAAVRGAARRAGEAAVRQTLGAAEPSLEPM